MDVGRDEFRKFAQLIELQRIDVQGRVSDAVLERLYQKTQFLDGATVAVHELFEGFARWNGRCREPGLTGGLFRRPVSSPRRPC